MPKVEFSDRFISSLKPQKIAADYFDTKAKGLNLRVTPTGVKSWSIMFTSPRDRKRARLSIGTYPATSLVAARTRAIEARSHVEAGTDPREMDKPQTGGAMTVAMLAEAYIEKHGRTLRDSTREEIERKMRSDVIPVIGNVKLADLHRRDIHRVLDPIKERGSAASAGKAFAQVCAMFNWAIERRYMDVNPVAGMKERGGSEARERFLEEEEIAALWPALSTLKAPVALALKLALVTGQRIGEVCGMTESELDRVEAVWTIPAERSKNGEAHKVPLSSMALDLIAQAKPIGSRIINKSANEIAQALHYKRDRLPVAEFTAHDLRRTVCTHLAKLGFSPVVIGSVVNHRQVTRQGVTLGVYVQYDYAKEKREALDLWADRLAAIIDGDAVKIYHLAKVQT